MMMKMTLTEHLRRRFAVHLLNVLKTCLVMQGIHRKDHRLSDDSPTTKLYLGAYTKFEICVEILVVALTKIWSTNLNHGKYVNFLPHFHFFISYPPISCRYSLNSEYSEVVCLALLATQYSVFMNNMSCLAWMFANITMISPSKKHRLSLSIHGYPWLNPYFILLYEGKSQGGTNLSRSYVLNSLTSQHLF